MAGFEVNIYEATKRAGGMVANAVPSFRLNDKQIARDLDRITNLGAQIHFEHPVDKKLFLELEKTQDYIYIATGARLSAPLDITNADAKGIIEPLQFLFDVRQGKPVQLGKNIAIIGGGNTAMDVARVVWRLTGTYSKITILYRRTIAEMPADKGEIEAVIKEGITILEQVAPVEIKTKDGAVQSVVMVRMEVKAGNGSIRPVPQMIAGSEFEMAFDTVIPAIGQAVDIDFIETGKLKSQNEPYTTAIAKYLLVAMPCGVLLLL
jgi:NADPH-dependent glutamate synthase beta subunit-like oxidoreductase